MSEGYCSIVGKRQHGRGGPIVGVAVAALSALLAWPMRADAQVIHWSNYLPPGHPILETVLKPWFLDVAKATGGRVTIRFFPSPWGPAPRQIDLVETVVRHAAFGSLGFTPHRYPIARVAELPFLSDRSEALSVAYWRTYRRFLARSGEFAMARPLTLAARTPGILWSPAKPFARLEDLRRIRLMVLGATPLAIGARLGASPFIAPPPLAGATLAAGKADGFLGLTGRARRLGLVPRLKMRTRIPGGLYANAYFVVVAPDLWRRIAPPDRAAIMAVSGARLARALGAAWDRETDDAGLAALGVETVDARPEFVAALKTRLAVFETRWLATATARGIDAAGALRYLRAEIAREEKALRQDGGK